MKAKETTGQNISRYLTFYLDDELYGIEIAYIQEIVAMAKTTSVPKTPKCIEGVMNLRGNIIPVVSFRTLLNMDYKEHEMYTAIIIVKLEGMSIGLIVDRVEEVVGIENDRLSEPPKFEAVVKVSFLKKMAQYDKNVIMILNLHAIFAYEELSELENISK